MPPPPPGMVSQSPTVSSSVARLQFTFPTTLLYPTPAYPMYTSLPYTTILPHQPTIAPSPGLPACNGSLASLVAGKWRRLGVKGAPDSREYT